MGVDSDAREWREKEEKVGRGGGRVRETGGRFVLRCVHHAYLHLQTTCSEPANATARRKEGERRRKRREKEGRISANREGRIYVDAQPPPPRPPIHPRPRYIPPGGSKLSESISS